MLCSHTPCKQYYACEKLSSKIKLNNDNNVNNYYTFIIYVVYISGYSHVCTKYKDENNHKHVFAKPGDQRSVTGYFLYAFHRDPSDTTRFYIRSRHVYHDTIPTRLVIIMIIIITSRLITSKSNKMFTGFCVTRSANSLM